MLEPPNQLSGDKVEQVIVPTDEHILWDLIMTVKERHAIFLDLSTKFFMGQANP